MKISFNQLNLRFTYTDNTNYLIWVRCNTDSLPDGHDEIVISVRDPTQAENILSKVLLDAIKNNMFTVAQMKEFSRVDQGFQCDNVSFFNN